MKLRHLAIRHFRGIRELSWPLHDRQLYCLIGCGDSTKSTILEAIRRALHPQWNLTFDDADFYDADVESPIEIDVLLGDLPDEFLSLTAYGDSLSGWDRSNLQIYDEPGEGLEDALHVRLSVEKNLEPSWTVIRGSNRTDRAFKPIDRAKASASLIEARPDYHLSWSKGSILSQATDKGQLGESLATAGRAARQVLDENRATTLTEFDKVASQAEVTAKALGVRVKSVYKAHLDSSALNVRQGALSLHDGTMPLRQLGLGSKRLLSTGLIQVAKDAPHITLFDEIESGLEPHRIARLVHHLKDDKGGQYIITTHSPVSVRELEIEDLYVLHHRDGVTEVKSAAVPGSVSALQGRVRSYAEAFLAPKVLVCEGATEVGVVRALDQIWQRRKLPSFAYQGVAPIAAGSASKVAPIASEIRLLNYDVAILADSDGDAPLSPQQVSSLGSQGITVVTWEGSCCTETRVFADLPWDGVMKSAEFALSTRSSKESFLDEVSTQYGKGFERDLTKWTNSERLRESLAKAANVSGWFKTQQKATQWFLAIEEWLLPSAVENTALGRQLNALRSWIDRV